MAATEGFWVHVDSALTGILSKASAGLMMQLSSSMVALFGSALTLYVIYFGYQTMAGKRSTPVEDFLFDFVKLAIIFSFFANVDGYLDSVADVIRGMKDGFSGGQNAWVLLDGLWEKTQKIADVLYSMDDSTVVKDNGALAKLFVWSGTGIAMAVTAIVTLCAQAMLLLMAVVSPLFIFCLSWGWLRPMFNNWLKIIFSSTLTILLSSLVVRGVTNFIDGILSDALNNADSANMMTQAAQVCLAGIMGAVFIWLSAKIAGALAGAGVSGVMQGMVAMGLSAAAYGFGRMAGGASKDTRRSIQDNVQGWRDANAGKPGKPGGELGYNAAKARKYAIEQMIARNEMRRNKGE